MEIGDLYIVKRDLFIGQTFEVRKGEVVLVKDFTIYNGKASSITVTNARIKIDNSIGVYVPVQDLLEFSENHEEMKANKDIQSTLKRLKEGWK